MAEPRAPGLMLVGHGSRSPAGVAEYWRLAEVVGRLAPGLEVGWGFVELAQPRLDAGIEALVARGAASVVAVPLVLLGAGHLKTDGPDALARARLRHPGVEFSYARHLGLHPAILALAEQRVREAAGVPGEGTFVVVVGRGSTDPDANADLAKVARLLWDGRGFAGVEAAFVSLAPPSVTEALERCRRLGARRIAVVPYFLFTGVLIPRIHRLVDDVAAAHPGLELRVADYLNGHPKLFRVLRERKLEALRGEARMNCALCKYRVPLPGHEHEARVLA